LLKGDAKAPPPRRARRAPRRRSLPGQVRRIVSASCAGTQSVCSFLDGNRNRGACMAACEACLLACLIPPARTIELVRLNPSRDGAERHHDPHWPPNRARDPGGCRTRAEDQHVRIANQVVFLEEGVGGWGEKSDMTVVRLGPVSRHSGLGAAEPLARACGECGGGVSVRVGRGRSRAGCVVVRSLHGG